MYHHERARARWRIKISVEIQRPGYPWRDVGEFLHRSREAARPGQLQRGRIERSRLRRERAGIRDDLKQEITEHTSTRRSGVPTAAPFLFTRSTVGKHKLQSGEKREEINESHKPAFGH